MSLEETTIDSHQGSDGMQLFRVPVKYMMRSALLMRAKNLNAAYDKFGRYEFEGDFPVPDAGATYIKNSLSLDGGIELAGGDKNMCFRDISVVYNLPNGSMSYLDIDTIDGLAEAFKGLDMNSLVGFLGYAEPEFPWSHVDEIEDLPVGRYLVRTFSIDGQMEHIIFPDCTNEDLKRMKSEGLLREGGTVHTMGAISRHVPNMFLKNALEDLYE